VPNETSTAGKSPAGSNTTPLQNSGFTHDAAEEEIQAHLARLRRQDPSITEQTEVLSSESSFLERTELDVLIAQKAGQDVEDELSSKQFGEQVLKNDDGDAEDDEERLIDIGHLDLRGLTLLGETADLEQLRYSPDSGVILKPFQGDIEAYPLQRKLTPREFDDILAIQEELGYPRLVRTGQQIARRGFGNFSYFEEEDGSRFCLIFESGAGGGANAFFRPRA
jgi:hypothetical protein